MSPVQACPTPQKLSNYLLGKLDEAEWESISVHLQTCDECLSQLDQMDESQDPMVHRLRHPQPDDDFMKEPECQLAVENSCNLDRLHATDLATLREYQLLEKLGEGGMGAVYRAIHTRLDREVAIKLLSANRLRSSEAISRFEREMKAIGRLHHPNIVQAFDAGDVDGQYYLAMELVSGLELSTLVQRLGPLPVADACEIVRQAALGLQHAHENELVHRDIKPSNLMLTDAGQVKILDLGLARLQEPLPDEREVTSTGQIMGTLDYMAPEQLGDTHSVDIRADIYSLGATLYKLLTGRAPYADKRYNTSQKKLMAIATKPVQPATDFRSDIPEDVVHVLNRMLAKDPDERFTAPAEVANALEKACEQADLPMRFAQAIDEVQSLEETDASAVSTFDSVASSFTNTESSLAKVTPQPATLAASGGWWGGRNRILIATALLAFFGTVLTVFYVRSGEATLIVDVDDESVAVELKKHGVVVRDKETGREYEVWTPGEEQLAVGNYELIVADDSGLRVNTQTFTLMRGEREIVRITLQEQEPVAKTEKPTTGESCARACPCATPPTLPEPRPRPFPSAPEGGDPISLAAVVTRPAAIEGVQAWTLDTVRHRGVVHALAFQPNSHLLAMAGDDAMIRILDVDSNQLVGWLAGHAARITSLCWSPDGTRIASGSEDQTVRIWDVQKGKLAARPIDLGKPIAKVAWSNHDELLAIGTASGEVCVWDVVNNQRRGEFRMESPEVPVSSLDWTEDGRSLVACSPRLLKICAKTESQQNGTKRQPHQFPSSFFRTPFGPKMMIPLLQVASEMCRRLPFTFGAGIHPSQSKTRGNRRFL